MQRMTQIFITYLIVYLNFKLRTLMRSKLSSLDKIGHKKAINNTQNKLKIVLVKKFQNLTDNGILSKNADR
jgi:hypothetical protein